MSVALLALFHRHLTDGGDSCVEANHRVISLAVDVDCVVRIGAVRVGVILVGANSSRFLLTAVIPAVDEDRSRRAAARRTLSDVRTRENFAAVTDRDATRGTGCPIAEPNALQTGPSAVADLWTEVVDRSPSVGAEVRIRTLNGTSQGATTSVGGIRGEGLRHGHVKARMDGGGQHSTSAAQDLEELGASGAHLALHASRGNGSDDATEVGKDGETGNDDL